jgi:hypothetical protein
MNTAGTCAAVSLDTRTPISSMRAHIPCAYRVSQMYTVYCTHVSHTSVTSLEAQSPTGLPPSFSNGTSFVLPLQQNINAARATAAPLTEPPAAGTSHTR